MKQYIINAQDSETFSLNIDERRSELVNQNWNRDKSQKLAASEGLTFNDEHWVVINYLRDYYLEQGVPRYARSLARDLKKNFSTQGGNKYLRNLFPGGAVTQGCRLANLRTPANATDVSFGTSY
ncbi:MAG: TusE/DsrC/DsvC family sulfur relay protein [Gammaproteobacteria bacterium]|nr:TusE/DsrC/DsvC family sulfur relay protein [Gammaproteobacteria bacterium]